ncbi:MAG: hypothetical protein ACPGUD_03280 [Parashewanella sp.]
MLQRIIETGLLKAQTVSPKQDEWKLAERKAQVLQKQEKISIAIELNPDIDKQREHLWLKKATLVLAAYEGAQDSSLLLQDERWLLWNFYDESKDDKALSQGVVMQLAIAQYLEKGFKARAATKKEHVVRMRT